MTCPLCHGPTPEPFVLLRQVPIFCNILYESERAARLAPCGNISLAACSACGFIYNSSFSPELVEYSPEYDNPLHFSPRFRRFAEDLGGHLVGTYGLENGTAVEIGCGDGFFLRLLIEKGMRQGIGYDPSMKGRIGAETPRHNLQIVPELFDKQHLTGRVDALVCRHVFEHVPDPNDFLKKLRLTIEDPASLVYLEVPNGKWIFEQIDLWDVIYEHFSYWTKSSLSTLFSRSGFDVMAVRCGFDGQFLMVEARPRAVPRVDAWPSSDDVRATGVACEHFGRAYVRELTRWRSMLRECVAGGGKAVLWGAGSKGVMFANLIAGREPLLAGLVDINPNKQRRYVGGAGLPTLAPEDLATIRPEIVLLMNNNYAPEVSGRLQEMGLETRLIGAIDDRFAGPR